VPLFPELRDELDALFEVAQGRDGAKRYVITRYRCSEANLRTTYQKIVERAGVESFPKPFMPLRRSRWTELERTGRFSNHVLNDWFGHSGAIAEKHSLQTTEDDFTEAAAGGNTGGNKQAETGESAKKAETPKPNKKRPKRAVFAPIGREIYSGSNGFHEDYRTRTNSQNASRP